jgi:YVTN family beta-propeller protein
MLPLTKRRYYVKVRHGRLPRTCNLSALALLPLFFLAGATPTEAQTKAYVADTNANLVTVIDTATGTVAGTIPVGTGPVRVAVSRDGTHAYVTNGGSDSISVIDTSCPLDETSCTPVIDTIPTGPGPSALAVTPDGTRLYVMTAAGVVEVVDTAQNTVEARITVGSSGDIAISPDGARAYVAAGLVYVIDTAANVVLHSFAAEQAHIADVTNSASSVAFSPDGKHAYVGVVTFDMTAGVFSAGGGLVLVDTASETVDGTINLFSLPGAIAFTPDGSRAYVGIQYIWVDTGYGAGFLPGRFLAVIDTITNGLASIIDLGADGASYTQQNTADGIAVTADRSAVYVAVPRIGRVAVANVNTNSVTTLVLVTPGPGDLGVVHDSTVALVPYAIVAADDSAAATTAGSTAVASVLANDQLGGIHVTTAHVTLSQQSSTSEGVALDPATGAVNVAAGSEVGTHTLVYRICEIAASSNCDDATVTVTVRLPYVVDAVNDSASTLPGRTALANVLANDTVDGTPAAARVTLSAVSSTSEGITLDVRYGSVFVAVGTAPGPHTLKYMICESASPSNCDAADVTITVIPFSIDAVNDTGAALRTGGTALANVLANDTFAGASATLATVRLSQLASTHAGISLDVANGAVTVAAGTPVGTYELRYGICEIATPSNCGEAIVTVAVQHLPITAANDSARASSKSASTALASVLTNDRLDNAAATTANVGLSLVSLTPASNKISLDVSNGSVKVLGKATSGTYTLVYQICEIAMPTNCAQATVTLDLSGSGGGGGGR